MGDATAHLPSSRSLSTLVHKNPYLSKWNILFDKVNCQWISFKPQEGHKVYPCYSCRDMFGSKSSFVDHVNRRGMVITYRCAQCHHSGPGSGTGYSTFRFYNPCSFMLHVRKHFTAMAGSLDLEHVNITTLPIELAGFFPHPSVPLIYDVQEDEIVANGNINTRFYSPIQANMGQRIVNLTPNVLLFQYSASGNKGPVSLVLKAISANIPRCQFVLLDYANNFPIVNSSGNTVVQQAIPLKQVSNGHQAILPTVNHSNKATAPVILNNSQHNIVIKDERMSTTEDEADTQEQDEEEDEFLEKSSEEPAQPTLKQHLTYNSKHSKYARCTECNEPVPGKMLDHMVGENRPCNDRYKCVTCNYVAPTKCSLIAHRRIHLFKPPYVCPECGRQFSNDVELMDHLDGVCFHMAKQVRFRCSGRNCGRIFAQSVTFSSHFMQTHMPSVYKCMVCSEFFFDEVDFSIHANSHATYQPPGTFYKCLVCKETGVTYTAENYMDHINWHCTHPAHRVYVLVCKYCRSYFRSAQTYAVHQLRCTKKVEENIQSNNNTIGGMPNSSMIRYLASNGSIMGKVVQGGRGKAVQQPDDTVTVLMEDSKSDIVRCIQCQETCALDALVVHMQHCKARNGNNQSNGAANRSIVRHLNGSNNPNQHNRNSNAADRKRKRPTVVPSSLSPTKGKKTFTDNGLDSVSLQLTVFDGTYVCKICDYRNTSRAEFQEHIVGHRHVSTAYQCMECGECFLVKPSLVKHLRYFHQIADTDNYLAENECCDQEAVTELVASINRGPVDRDADALAKEPLNENQCRVCRLQCDNEQELNKHFRVHGMAFIGNRNTSTSSTKATT